jgi:hypothetical protein
MMTHATEGVAEDPHAFWITTQSGQHFYPKDPEGSVFDIADIAHALSLTCRFAGHCNRFYSVAEHSVLVAQLAESSGAGLWGLLHDASEAYLVDIPRPIKYLPEMAGYRALESRTTAAILESFGLRGPEPATVKEADRLMLRSEAEALGLLRKDWDVFNWPDCGLRPVPLAPGAARRAFLQAYARLSAPTSGVLYRRPCQFCGSASCSGEC